MTSSTDRTKAKGASRSRRSGAAKNRASRIERATELSEQVIGHVATGQSDAIEAVRGFMASADRAVPALRSRPTRAHTLIDSALEMSERLVKVEHDLVRGVVHSTGRAVVGGPEGKPDSR